MIDGIEVLMTTQTLKVLREQVERGEDQSTVRVPHHLRGLAIEARAIADAIADYIPANAGEEYLNASKGGP